MLNVNEHAHFKSLVAADVRRRMRLTFVCVRLLTSAATVCRGFMRVLKYSAWRVSVNSILWRSHPGEHGSGSQRDHKRRHCGHNRPGHECQGEGATVALRGPQLMKVRRDCQTEGPQGDCQGYVQCRGTRRITQAKLLVPD